MDKSIDPEEITEEMMMEEFINITSQEIAHNELTVEMFVEKAKVGKNRARYILKKYEEKGLLKVRDVRVDKYAVNAYSPISGSWKDLVEEIKKEL